MSDSIHATVPETIGANVQHLANSAQHGCGCSYEIYQDTFSQRVDALLATTEDSTAKAAILNVAREFDYVTRAELSAMREDWMDDGACRHGLDPDCCPLGCGDL